MTIAWQNDGHLVGPEGVAENATATSRFRGEEAN
jgi:hypothetical protein